MADNPITNRETWMIRVALGIFVVFTVFGIYLLFNPTDLLTAIFAVLLAITLGAGVILGLLILYNS